MNFINNIDFVFPELRRIFYRIAQIPDLVHPVVARRVDLDNIQGFFVIHPKAVIALSAWISVFRIQAVDCFRKDFCRGSFSCAPGSAEKIGVSDPLGDHLIPQRFDNRLLPYHLGKVLGSPFTV